MPDVTPDESSHSRCVDAWFARAASGLDRCGIVDLLDAALGALWARANVTLGDVTLTAIVDRVLHNAGERYVPLAALALDESGVVSCAALRSAADDVPDDALRDGVRFALTELLTVLGNLTADILTEELHAELAKVSVPGKTSRRPSAAGNEEKGR